MLNTNIQKLEMAKIEMQLVGVKLKKAMRKLETIMSTMEKLEQEMESDVAIEESNG